MTTTSRSVARPRSVSRLLRLVALSTIAVSLGLGSAGCGHSEEEWQAKLKEIDGLNKNLKALQGDKKKCDDELAKANEELATARAEIAALTDKAGGASKQLEEQRRLIERLRKEKEQLDAIKARFEQLKKKLEQLTKLGLNVTVRNNRMVIQLPGDVLFKSGRTDLEPKGKEMLQQVADVISKDAGLASRNYQVAGHTDAKPYAGELRDNWGLSLMRAREVLVFLVSPPGKTGGGGLDKNRWAASGYAETDPIATNDTDEGRQKNRRVELVVMPNVEEMLDLKSLTH